MSGRKSREALLQDELMNSVRMGAILQEQGNSERRYQLGVDEAKRVADARAEVPFLVAGFDADTPDAQVRYAEISSKAGVLDPRDQESLLRPIQKKLEERNALESEARNHGVAPVFTRREDGSQGLDRPATRTQIMAKQVVAIEEAQGFLPDTLRLKAALADDTLFQKMPVYAQHEELRRQDSMFRGVNDAVVRGLMTSKEVNELYKSQGAFDGVVSSHTGVTTGGQPHLFGAVMIDPIKYAELVEPRLQTAMRADASREQSAGVAEALGAQSRIQASSLGTLQELLKRADEGEINLPDSEVEQLRDLYKSLALENVTTVRQAGEAGVLAAGTVDATATVSRVEQSNAKAADTSARSNRSPLSKSSPNFPAQYKDTAVGSLVTGPDGSVYYITN